jgi:hypothetical protein
MFPITSQTARADSVLIPHTFVAYTPAVAADVNACFDAVKTAVDDNDARIAALESALAALQVRLALVESNAALDLGPYVSIDTNTINGLLGPHVIFTGANIHVRSGSGYTDDDGTLTGLGNLIVGYNEELSTPVIGRGGAHNIVVGVDHEYSSYGGLVAGDTNIISGSYASVSGGFDNTAGGESSSVSGGFGNTASIIYSSVSGGNDNTASGYTSSVSGGLGNTADGSYSSVSGGYDNDALGSYSSVSGGYGNEADDYYSSVSGGQNRSVSGYYDWAAGSLFEDF